MLVRAQEMARYVGSGALDAGITGKDWILETSGASGGNRRTGVREDESRPRALGAGGGRRFAGENVRDLEGKVIATEAVHLTEQYLQRHGVRARVEFSWGATEMKVPQLADAIVEVTETGASLRANHLRIVDTLLESAPWFIAHRASLAGPMEARKNPEHGLAAGRRDQGVQPRRLDAQRAPRESCKCAEGAARFAESHRVQLSDPDWVAINTIVEERTVRQLIPKLKSARAEGIVEYPLNKIVY